MNANLFAHFELAANEVSPDGSRLFLDTPGGAHFTYGDCDRISAQIANALARAGVKPGDRVAVQVEKSPEALLVYLACLRAGAVYLPLNSAYQAAEVRYFLDNAEPSAVIAQPPALSWLEPMAHELSISSLFTLDESGGGSLMAAAAQCDARYPTITRNADDLAAILYTSGTTGRSKGAMLSHGNLLSNAQTLVEAWGFSRDDVLVHGLPLFHVHGLFVACHCALLSGARLRFHARFDAAATLADLAHSTVFMGVPTHYVRLLAEPGLTQTACAQMRLFISGSAPLAADTFEAFTERTAHTILERYGMTETVMLTSNPLKGPRKKGTVGPPLPGVSVRVVDGEGGALSPGEIGQIEVSGPNVLAGYWRMPEKTREEFTADGFFKTGDVGRFDADGYLAIVGRSKDLVITGGYNVYPKEIELLIDALPGVRESAVIGLPHPDFGEAVTAVVVPANGHPALTEQALIAELKTQLANFKVPKRIFFVDELPRNTMGKVQKNVLRERYA